MWKLPSSIHSTAFLICMQMHYPTSCRIHIWLPGITWCFEFDLYVNGWLIKRPFFAGFVTTIAGGSNKTGHSDGQGLEATFSNDFAVTYVRNCCCLLVADHGNRMVRQIQLPQVDGHCPGVIPKAPRQNILGGKARDSTLSLNLTNAWFVVPYMHCGDFTPSDDLISVSSNKVSKSLSRIYAFPFYNWLTIKPLQSVTLCVHIVDFAFLLSLVNSFPLYLDSWNDFLWIRHLISRNERRAWSSSKFPHSILGSKLYILSYRNSDACIKVPLIPSPMEHLHLRSLICYMISSFT